MCHEHGDVFVIPVTLESSVVILCTTRFNIQQERQFTYKVTWKRVHESIVTVGNKYYIFQYMCVCVCAHARMRVSARAPGRVSMHGRVDMRMCVRMCSLTYSTCKEHAQLFLSSLASLPPLYSSTLDPIS